jgi:hypothetical protein
VTDPHDTTRHGVICLPDYIVHLVVTRQDTGEVLYSSDATCGDWDDSGAKISIIEIDGRIEARASLDDEE